MFRNINPCYLWRTYVLSFMDFQFKTNWLSVDWSISLLYYLYSSETLFESLYSYTLWEKFFGRDTYGWRKCSNSQARRTKTEFSGRPRWGLQAWGCMKPLCCLKCWSTYLSRLIVPTPFPSEPSCSPRHFRVTTICPDIASLRLRKWREMVWRASAVYGLAAP